MTRSTGSFLTLTVFLPYSREQRVAVANILIASKTRVWLQLKGIRVIWTRGVSRQLSSWYGGTSGQEGFRPLDGAFDKIRRLVRDVDFGRTQSGGAVVVHVAADGEFAIQSLNCSSPEFVAVCSVRSVRRSAASHALPILEASADVASGNVSSVSSGVTSFGHGGSPAQSGADVVSRIGTFF